MNAGRSAPADLADLETATTTTPAATPHWPERPESSFPLDHGAERVGDIRAAIVEDARAKARGGR